MAMMPTLFSLRGLAVELGRDVRGVAKAMRNAPPDGKTGAKQSQAWYLQTALRAITAYEARIGGNGPSKEIGADVLIELERVAPDLQGVLDNLAAEPNIKKRFAGAKVIGPQLIRFHAALDRSGELLPSGLRDLTGPVRGEILGEALAAVGSTLGIDFAAVQ